MTGVGEQGADTSREICGEGQAPTCIGRDFWIAVTSACDHRRHVFDTDEAQQLPRKHEGVTRLQTLEKVFLNLSQNTATVEAHFQRGRLYNGADIHAIAADRILVDDNVVSVLVLAQPVPSIIGSERIAAIFYKPQRVVEISTFQRAISSSSCDLSIQHRGIERAAARHAQDELSQHIQCTGLLHIPV